jgi:polysaccharide biosynthesis transport protein
MLPRAQSGLSADLVMAYLAIALRHLRLMCLLLCLALSLGLAFYTFARPVFHAKSLVHVQRFDRPMDRTVGAEAVFIDGNDKALLSEFASDYMVERTAKRLGVTATRSAITSQHLKKISVGYDGQGNIIVEVWPYSNEWAHRWTEAMVTEYLAYREEKRHERRETAIETFTREIAQIRERMDEAFSRKYDFKEASEMDRLLIEFEELSAVPRDLMAANRRLSSMEQTRRALENSEYDAVTKLSLLSMNGQVAETRRPAMTVGQLVPANDGDNQPGSVIVPAMLNPSFLPWQELEREQRRVQAEVRRLESSYLPGHPKMQDLSRQLAEIERALAVELEIIAQRFWLEYRALQARASELEGKLGAMQEVTRRHQRRLQEFAQFDAGQLAWSNIHNQMTKHLSALDFWADKERAELQFMSNLEARDFPVSPNKLKLVLASLVFGLGLAITVPFFLEYINTSITDPDRAEEDLQVTSLGLIPYLDRKAPSKDPNDQSNREQEFEEHFRMVRTNLMLGSEQEETPHVLLVTSSLPNEGKTTVSQNMAKSFAQRGERTLLIDADLRRGSQHKSFGASGRPGLAGLLDPLGSAEPTIVSIAPNLDLLPCGRNTGRAAELIDSPRFSSLMKELRSRYQRIVIDSPPALGLAESPILQRHADAIILVVWSEYTPMHAIRDTVRSIKANGGKIRGFVLNRVDFRSVYYQYRYFYYSPGYYSKYALAAESVTK